MRNQRAIQHAGADEDGLCGLLKQGSVGRVRTSVYIWREAGQNVVMKDPSVVAVDAGIRWRDGMYRLQAVHAACTSSCAISWTQCRRRGDGPNPACSHAKPGGA
jgi:hypothetical protein